LWKKFAQRTLGDLEINEARAKDSMKLLEAWDEDDLEDEEELEFPFGFDTLEAQIPS